MLIDMEADATVSAWAHLCRVHGSVARSLEGELERDFGLSLTSFGVLRALAEAEGTRSRLNCLAASADMTKSGISRLIDRLEAAKLVTTEGCPSDGRGSFAVLTGAGQDVVQKASDLFCARVKEVLTTSLSEADVSKLGKILERIT
jgi:DNA-binding MarR family transcriptional regulator